MKIAIWDLETTDLNAEFGRLICGSILDHETGKMVTYRQDDFVRRKKSKGMADDGCLAVAIRDALEKFHLHYTWFGKGFDVSFLNTRLVANGERRLRSTLHLDGVWFVKGWRGLRPKSAKLADVAVFFKLDERKPEVDPQVWIDARGGDKKAMDEAVRRCEADVRLTQKAILKILDTGLVKNIGAYP